MLNTAFIVKPASCFSYGTPKQFLMFRIIQSQIIERLHHITINPEVYFGEDLTCFMQAFSIADYSFGPRFAT